MTRNNIRHIQLPSLPASWNQLSAKQLEEVNRLMQEMQQAKLPSQEAEPLFKLKCFLLFLDLKVTSSAKTNEQGETVFFLRRKGWRYLTERLPICAWQVTQWVDEKLKFMNTLTGRLLSPYPYIWVRMGTLKLKGPDDLLTNLTFHQYLSAQNLLASYWSQLEALQKLSEENGSRKEMRRIAKQLKELRCYFLAVLFNESVRISGEIREGRYVRSVQKKVWTYTETQGQRNARYFRGVEHRVFPVMLQFFQSVQVYYAQMFPDLYTESSDSGKKRSQMQIEVEMINNVMKYQGFTDYDSVYGSEAIRILEIMNRMSHEAREIEKMNQKYAANNKK